jgi:hypothetical protein
MTGTWLVDSIEDGIAALHAYGRVMHLPAELLPEGTRDGDVLHLERRAEDGVVTLRLRVDRVATERAADAARRRLQGLQQGDPGGDLEL